MKQRVRPSLARRLAVLLVVPVLLAGCDGIISGEGPSDGARISGTVRVDLDGDGMSATAGEDPLEGVTVLLADCGNVVSQRTGPDGRFDFTGLPAGSCRLSISLVGYRFVGAEGIEGYPVPVRAVTGESREISLVMAATDAPARAALRGRVIDGDIRDRAAAGIAGAVIWVSGCGPARSATSDERGRFLITDLRAGSCTVEIRAAGFALDRTEPFSAVRPPLIPVTGIGDDELTLVMRRRAGPAIAATPTPRAQATARPKKTVPPEPEVRPTPKPRPRATPKPTTTPRPTPPPTKRPGNG